MCDVTFHAVVKIIFNDLKRLSFPCGSDFSYICLQGISFSLNFFPLFSNEIFLENFQFFSNRFSNFWKEKKFPYFPRIRKSVRASLRPLRSCVFILCPSPNPLDPAQVHFCKNNFPRN